MELLNDAHYTEYFAGFRIVDTAVASPSRLYFLLTKLDGKRGARIVRLTLSDDGPELASNDMTGYDTDEMFMEMAYPDRQLLVMDCDSSYFISPKGSQPGIPSIAQGGPRGSLIARVRAMGQLTTLAFSSSGELMGRDAEEAWSRVGPAIDAERPSWARFHDFDGYALDDIYAAGDEGVYHFDGTSWEKTNGPKGGVSAVCCTPGGVVYATTFQPGRITLFQGCDGQWKKVFEDRDKHSHANPLSDLVWHDGMLWGSSWSELWTWRDGEKVARPFPDTGPSGGRLSARDGVLLCASVSSIYLRDTGGDWRTLLEGGPVS